MEITKKHFDTHKSIFRLNLIKKFRKKGLYEVWFTILNGIESGQGFWIRYTLLIPKQNPNGDLQGEALLWFAYSSIKDASQNFMIKKSFPITEALETTEDYIIKIADSVLTLVDLKGGFTISNGRQVSWDLVLSGFLEPYIATPKLAQKLGLTEALSFATHPTVQISGEISMGNQVINLDNAPGLQYHTYGPSYSIPWEWANAHTFATATSAYLDFGYKVSKGIIEFFNGNKTRTPWNNSIFSKLRTTKEIKREHSHTHLEFTLEKKNYQISGVISTPQERLIAVEYLGPQGNRYYCYNTTLADLVLTITEDGHTTEHSISSSVAFETVYPEPIDGIPYLPWASQSIDEIKIP